MSGNLPAERTPIKDRTNPRSVINIVPSLIEKAIDCIPDDFFSMTTDELAEMFRKGRAKYTKETEIEEKLRIAFWKEYDRCVERGTRMELTRICMGVCHPATFSKMAIGNSARLAYILTPPEDYITTMEELLKLGLEQLRDILLQPHVRDDGTLDARAADVKFKIVESVTLRVKGAVASRIETRNLNVNVDTEKPAQPGDVSNITDLAKIEEEIRKLSGQDSTGAETIDVTPKS